MEGQAGAEAELDQDRRAAQLMEAELSARFDFYEANSGHYEGTLTQGATQYRIRISLFPSLPRYRGARLRSQQEVQTELSLLAMNAQITQWNPAVPAASVGCRVEGLRPNLVSGELNVISASCPSSYFLLLGGNTITGTAEPSNNPTVFDIAADRLP